jgi:hypothetical protein
MNGVRKAAAIAGAVIVTAAATVRALGDRVDHQRRPWDRAAFDPKSGQGASRSHARPLTNSLTAFADQVALARMF